jgi:pimeloyl-ACP methyl ester carboxylesterase
MFVPRGPVRPRVVFLPGALGSVLIDTGLTPEQARRECDRNLGVAGNALLRGSALYPCDKRPEALWGTVGSLHWMFAPDAWGRRMVGGNGWDRPGDVRPDSLVNVEVRLRRRTISFHPYASFVRGLVGAGADVLVFPYDWRLSGRQNAYLLQRRVLDRWFGGRLAERQVPDDERIIVIGHSMGGLIARYFLESPLQGHRLARRLITIGTPHRGAPQAWLHLTGRTLPLPDNPLYRQLRAAGIPPAAVSAHGMPARIQTALLRSMASTFQLLPVYDFVTSKGRRERHQATYRDEKHTGTGRSAGEAIRDLRSGLIDPCHLVEWLSARRLDYHLVAATGFPTPLGYDRDPDRIVTGRDGDATVPLISGRLFPQDTGDLHNVILTGGALSHARLCERPDVLAHCQSLLRGSRAPRPAQALATGVSLDGLVTAARLIMDGRGTPKHQGRVLSVTHLVSIDGTPMVDPASERIQGSKRRRLTNPPCHVSSPEIFEIDVPGVGRLQYVWILSNAAAASSVGGMLFLGPTHTHLVTYNVGRLDRDYRRACDNLHHAEMQLNRWLTEQPPSWHARLRLLYVANRSRDTDIRGYSPCRVCCLHLAPLLKEIRQVARRPVDAAISWCELYRGYRACRHATTDASLQLLTAADWRLVNLCPSTAPAAPARLPLGV